mmetsp:Transcript_59677/g.71706  ORF Transcript_59677/g.71706 Transcript_59677/m.71706 type:complete len:346 (-) Transcript_59677:67-1104(-)
MRFCSFLEKTDQKSINRSHTDANNSESSKDSYIQNEITDHDYSPTTTLITLLEANQLDRSLICRCCGLYLQPFIFYDKSKSSSIKTKKESVTTSYMKTNVRLRSNNKISKTHRRKRSRSLAKKESSVTIKKGLKITDDTNVTIKKNVGKEIELRIKSSDTRKGKILDCNFSNSVVYKCGYCSFTTEFGGIPHDKKIKRTKRNIEKKRNDKIRVEMQFEIIKKRNSSKKRNSIERYTEINHTFKGKDLSPSVPSNYAKKQNVEKKNNEPNDCDTEEDYISLAQTKKKSTAYMQRNNENKKSIAPEGESLPFLSPLLSSKKKRKVNSMSGKEKKKSGLMSFLSTLND